MKKQYLSIKLPNIAPLNLWTLSHITFNKESTGKKTVHIMGFFVFMDKAYARNR